MYEIATVQQKIPSLSIIVGKTDTYGIKGVLRHYNYMSDIKLCPGVVSTRTIPCRYHDCTKKKSYLGL